MHAVMQCRLTGHGRGLLCACLIVVVTAGPAPAAESERTLEPAALGTVTDGIRTMGEDAKALVTAPMRMDRQDWLITGGALAGIGLSFALDKPIDKMVGHNQHSGPHDVAQTFNTLGSAEVLLAVNAGMIGMGYWQESYGYSSGLKKTGLISLEAELFAVGASFALKEVTGRSRPERHEGTSHFEPFGNGSGSFVSTHAAASFAVASVLADRHEWGWLAYGVAGAVAGSRIYTQQHFASDVVAGGLIGWGIGRFLSRRHRDDGHAWRLQPAALMDGGGFGIAVGRKF
jgi:membrane-associated phospholipid phosphatase